jgi:hypothetical protein
MNERIRQLAVEAGFYANPDIEKFEKFAELIVEEVYDYILNATFDDEPWPSRKEVKQHFGVEK